MKTSILNEGIVKIIESKDVFLLEQKGWKKKEKERKESYGYKDYFFIKKMIMENSRSKKKNQSMALIDNKNIFDSLPPRIDSKNSKHFKDISSYNNISKIEYRKVANERHIIQWKSILETNYLNINNRIFLGNSLFPLLFCTPLIPFSIELKYADYEFKTTSKNKPPILYRQFKVICKKLRFWSSTKHCKKIYWWHKNTNWSGQIYEKNNKKVSGKHY